MDRKSSIDTLNQSNEPITDRSNFNNKIHTDRGHFPQDEIVAYGYGLQLYNSQGEFLDQETIELDAKELLFASVINSTENESEVGIILTIDGIPQRFTVDAIAEEKYIYRINLEQKTLVNIPFAIKKPVVTKAGDHSLAIIMLYDLDKMPSPAQPFIDFYTNTMVRNLEFNNQDSLIKVKQEFHGKVVHSKIENPSRGVVSKINVYDDNINFNSQNPIIELPQSSHKLVISNRAPIGHYSSIVLVDNDLIPIGNDMNYSWSSNGVDEITNMILDLDEKYSKGDHSIFQLTLPVSDNLPYTYGSSKQVLHIPQ